MRLCSIHFLLFFTLIFSVQSIHAQFTMYGGGDSDGFVSEITSTVLSSNNLVIYNGSSGDGHSSLTASALILSNNASVTYAGGTGDGHTNNELYATITGDSPILYFGGDEDGFANRMFTALPGELPLTLFSGGDGDGQVNTISHPLILAGTLDIYAGADGDGFVKELASSLLLDEGSLSLYNGSDGDGFASGLSLAYFTEALPIELVSFEAKQVEYYVLLFWKTATEINNDRFEIERSHDGMIFTKIDELKGSGTTFDNSTYQYLDKHPQIGNNYYQLKQIDYDGKSSYSPIRWISFTSDEAIELTIYPNPNRNRVLNINLHGISLPETVKMEIFDMSGTLLSESEVNPKKSIDLTWNYLPGIYQVTFHVGDLVIGKRLMIVD